MEYAKAVHIPLSSDILTFALNKFSNDSFVDFLV